MEYLLLYKVQNYFLVLNEASINNGITYSEEVIPLEVDLNTCIDLADKFDIEYKGRIVRRRNVGKDSMVIEYLNVCELFSSFFPSRKLFYEKKISDFRLSVRDLLIKKISSKSCSLSDALDAYAKYTLQDEYSLWVYNEDSGVFTAMCSSFDPEVTYIKKSDGTYLNDIFENPNDVVSREPNDCPKTNLSGMGVKWMTRFYLQFGINNQPAVLTFYSKNEGLSVQKKVIEDVRNIVELKYNGDVKETYQTLHKAFERILGNQPGSFKMFIENLSDVLKEEYDFQSISAFYCDDGEFRKLYSVSDSARISNFNDEPVHESKGLSECVSEGGNVHIYYDPTDSLKEDFSFVEGVEDAKNIVVIPISDGNTIRSVLVAVNIYFKNVAGKRFNQHLSPVDNFNITALVSIAEAQLVVIVRMLDLEERLSAHENISKVYQHEIRGPIGSILSIPQQIIDMMKCYDGSDGEREFIISLLEDLNSLTHNLSFIAKANDVEKLVEDFSEDRSVQLLQDVIFPIEKITKKYFKDKYRSVIDFDHSDLKRKALVGTSELLQMVFYALLDNAGKYRKDERSGYVKVYGRDNGDGYFTVIVENDGLRISEDEVDKVFENNYRGKEAVVRRIDGSGIGLWLCRKVILKYGGDIVIDSLSDPVRIFVKLKYYEGGDEYIGSR